MTATIPTINLEPMFSSEKEKRLKLASAINSALETVGFFQIVGHNVEKSLVQQMREEAYSFFRLPIEEKLKVRRPLPEITRGYDPPAQQSLAATKDAAAPPDLQEGFGVGGFDFSQDDPYYTQGLGPYFFSPNLWPEGRPVFRQTLEQYHSVLKSLAADLMGVFALALDLDETFFVDKISKTGSHMRLNKYPAQTTPPVPGQLRSGAHTDYGTLTILYGEDSPGGLQVMLPDNKWHDIHPEPEAFVINIGDCMARWTNDRWRSTLHRVNNPPSELANNERLSVAFFHSTNYDAEIKCLESCKSSTNTSKHDPIHYAAYYIDKLMKSRQTV